MNHSFRYRSLVVLAGWAGQISLGQFALVGVGAAVTGALIVHVHLDFALALVLITLLPLGWRAASVVMIAIPL